jgi:hypothetical protein
VVRFDNVEELLEQEADPFDLVGLALNADRLTPGDDPGVECLLDLLQIAVELAENRG